MSRLVQEKLPAVFVEMAALVYAVRPQSRFVMVYCGLHFRRSIRELCPNFCRRLVMALRGSF